MVMMTKEERRDSLSKRDALIAEGKSWFKYIEKEFEELVEEEDGQEGENNRLFLAIGLLGNLAELDTDDVDYPGEGTGDEHSD